MQLIQTDIIHKISPTGQVTQLSLKNLNQPWGITIDTNGDFLIADTYNHQVKRFSPNGTLLFCAGKGTAGFENGSSQNATFNYPTCVAITKNRDLIVVDNGNRAIRKITSDGTVSTIVDGSKSTIKIIDPQHLVLDDNDNIFVTDYDDHSIKQITMDGIVTNYMHSNEWKNPFGIVLHHGVMYFSDFNGHCIYKIWKELWNTG